MFTNKNILIGIGGGIAVYRVAELARLLIKQGAHVRCVMTRSACEFVTPLTFEALTGEKTHTELFNLTSEREMGHIQLARWADAVLIAPATANQLAKYAHGIADDLLSTIIQVCEKPILLAPAMNVSMWQSAANQANVTALQTRGYHFVGPVAGELACGETGEGRLAEPETIIQAIPRLLCEQNLAGQRWIINTGPTWESWDVVRILSNRSSGELGVCLAEIASAMGADVTLIAGPGTPPCSSMLTRINIESANDMLAACEQATAEADVFIAAAAISDYRFSDIHTDKLKRQGDSTPSHALSVELIENPDIAAHIAAMPRRPKRVIAFAAESDNHIKHAREKLQRKGADAIIANDASQMGKSTGKGWWIDEKECHEISGGDKQAFASQIINNIMEHLS